eukprot:TRINITY_DN5137_c0_g1_i5.p1 TRINITY_DN5137_c0_g1~~TRINITY_DN5137_c0_g1_i5.p1  ORF type:complete len:360 (-),score=68.52 TRINITY_DN5137_c0_g1_i5:142-1221(-)
MFNPNAVSHTQGTGYNHPPAHNSLPGNRFHQENCYATGPPGGIPSPSIDGEQLGGNPMGYPKSFSFSYSTSSSTTAKFKHLNPTTQSVRQLPRTQCSEPKLYTFDEGKYKSTPSATIQQKIQEVHQQSLCNEEFASKFLYWFDMMNDKKIECNNVHNLPQISSVPSSYPATQSTKQVASPPDPTSMSTSWPRPTYRWDENPGLGRWVSLMRKKMKEGKLDEQKKSLLTQLSFSWSLVGYRTRLGKRAREDSKDIKGWKFIDDRNGKVKEGRPQKKRKTSVDDVVEIKSAKETILVALSESDEDEEEDEDSEEFHDEALDSASEGSCSDVSIHNTCKRTNGIDLILEAAKNGAEEKKIVT